MKTVISIPLLFVVLFYGCSTDNNGNTAVIPLAPTNLTATVISTTQVNLTWTDNSTNESGYKVERKILGSNFAQVGTTGENITTFSDLNLTPNTTYVYRVVGYNSAGNSIQYSNEDTVVTTIDTMPSSLNNGLVAYYPFTGNAVDSSGNGNNGTVNGATLTTDRFGITNKAYSFNGVDNYISVPRIYQLDFSLSFWVYSASVNQYNPLIDAFDSNWEFDLKNAYPDFVSFIDGIYYQEYISNTSISNNNWHHLVCTYSSNTVKIYVNGFMTDQFIINSFPNSNGNYILGASLSGSDQYFKGKLDDIRIYNRVLSQPEITYLATH